jgi:hypothetical protein
MTCRACGRAMVHLNESGQWFWGCGGCGRVLLPVPTQTRMPGG